jgi:hypothetical protein
VHRRDLRVAAEVALQLHDVLREGLRRSGIAPQRAHRRLVGAGRAAEPEVDPVRVQRRERAELLRDHQRRVVGQHHAAGAEPDRLRVRGHVGDHDRRRRGGDRREVVVLGVPDPLVAELLGALRQPHGGLERVAGGLVLADRSQVEDGERHAQAR